MLAGEEDREGPAEKPLLTAAPLVISQSVQDGVKNISCIQVLF